MALPFVKSIETTKTVINAGKYQHLAPKMRTERTVIETVGTPTPIINALRITIMNEFPTKILAAEFDDIQSDDEFIITPHIMTRLTLIPIMQNVKEDTEFVLKYKNDSPTIVDIKTSDFKPELPANDNIIILRLNPGCYINITAKIVTTIGYMRPQTETVGVIAIQAAAVPSVPINMYNQYVQVSTEAPDAVAEDRAKRGERSGVSKCTQYYLKFTSFGTMPPKDIFNTACEIIIRRLDILSKCEIISTKNEHIVQIPGESETLGPAMIYEALQVNFTSNMTMYTPSNERLLKLSFRLGDNDDDPKKFIMDCVAGLTKKYKALMIK